MNPKSLVRFASSIAGAALVSLCLPARANAAPFDPLNSPSSSEHHQGKLIWVDLITSNPTDATTFYCNLLGWTSAIIDQKGNAYTVFSNGGHPVAGLAPHTMANAAHVSRWVGYLAVSDIDQTLSAAKTAGAVVHASSRNFKKRGYQAIIGDPQGVPLGLLQSTSGDPADTEPKPGDWNWFEVYVKSPKQAAVFYKDVLGYDVSPDNRGEAKSEFLLASGGQNRGGIAMMPDGDDVHPTWLGVIRVADLDATLAKVPTLGGQVLVQPRTVEFGSRFAIILDPTGGTVGLVQYMDDSNPAQNKTP
jgi:uncharacterized protein